MVHHQESSENLLPKQSAPFPGVDTSNLRMLGSRIREIIAPQEADDRSVKKSCSPPSGAMPREDSFAGIPGIQLEKDFFPERISEKRGTRAIEISREQLTPGYFILRAGDTAPNKSEQPESASEEKYGDARLLADQAIHKCFRFRRGGSVRRHSVHALHDRSYSLPTSEDRRLFAEMKSQAAEILRASMPEYPSPLREQHLRFFEPRIKLPSGSSGERILYTLAELRNSNGDPLVYSNDTSGDGRWIAIPRTCGPAMLEIYNSTDAISLHGANPADSWKSGTIDFSHINTPPADMAANIPRFNYRVLYSPQALRWELSQLADPEMVQRYLTPGVEGSFVFYQMLRAASAEAEVPLDCLQNGDFHKPVTVTRLSSEVSAAGTRYRVTFNDYDNASAVVFISLKSKFSAEEYRLLRQQNRRSSPNVTQIRESIGIVSFNRLKPR